MVGLPAEFYDRPVLEVARELLGCTLAHGETAGIIVETEAYHESEPACHAFIGRTPRTLPLFGPPGHAYVYRSYGIHALMNAVCEPIDVGAAVLIRALEPTVGLELMRIRREPALKSPRAGRRALREHELCSGPGKLTKALGITLAENESELTHGQVRVYPRSESWAEPEVLAGPRVGIARAVELPWRFHVGGNASVSGRANRSSSG